MPSGQSTPPFFLFSIESLKLVYEKSCLSNRNELDGAAPRCFACLRPIKVTIANHPGKGKLPPCSIPNHPSQEAMGKREMEFTPTIYIDESDFREKDPGAKYFGLAPGKTVRLLHAYDIKCLECAATRCLPCHLVLHTTPHHSEPPCVRLLSG